MRWRWLLQQGFGGISRIPGAAARVIDVTPDPDGRCRLGISAACLTALFTSQAPMLIFRGALPAARCRHAAAYLEKVALAGDAGAKSAQRFAAWHLGADPEAPAADYTKLGYTKTDVLMGGVRMAAGRPAPEKYLDLAEETSAFLREQVFAPYGCPMDEIWKELDALDGITCLRERCPETNRPFLPYVVRCMVAGGRRAAGNVHMDTVVPGRTFSVNLYLRVPDSSQDDGGEVILYPVKKDALSRVLNGHFFETVDIQNFYPDQTFYTQALLDSEGMEPLVYKPAAGDVVFLDPAYPHAVRDFQSPSTRHRISCQTFVQLRPPAAGQNGQILEYAV